MTGLATLWINTGTLCNLACRTCYIESSPRNDALVYLSLSEANRFMDELGSPIEIGLTGGEPGPPSTAAGFGFMYGYYSAGVALVDALAETGGDPVAAWASIVENPEQARVYKSQRGHGGLVRVSWEEALQITAAAHVHTIKKWGPDRVAGFSPIPAMSPVSYASGARFPLGVTIIGGLLLGRPARARSA